MSSVVPDHMGGVIRKAFSELIILTGKHLMSMAESDTKTSILKMNDDNSDLILAFDALAKAGVVTVAKDHVIGAVHCKLIEKPSADTITITVDQYNSLIDDEQWRAALEVGGVDNWEHYHQSLKDYGYFNEED